MRSIRCSLPILIVALSCSRTPTSAQETGFLRRAVEVDGVSYKYQVFVPSHWTPDEKWPVILFLHGAGKRGADGTRQTDEGLPEVLRQTPDFPAVVVMPQCRRRTWWGEPAMEAQTFGALEQSMKELNGDPERIYLTGLSMGGFGTWAFGYKYPEMFAALVPVCGGVKDRRFPAPDWHPLAVAPDNPYRETAEKIARLPVWSFHGDADTSVPVSESRKLNEALQAAGGNVKYTEYPGVGHRSWGRAYSEEELLPWLLAQKKSR
jgi:predicted peptidase